MTPSEAGARWHQLLADLKRDNVETDVAHPYPAGLRDEAAWGEPARSADALLIRAELVHAASLATQSEDEETGAPR
eukprot:4402223-Alexandrium_andersonii.AAC.1